MAFPFSDTAELTGIVQAIDFNCDTDAVSYPLKDKARNTNRWLYRLVVWMFKSSPFWEWDDRNHTNSPKARTTLVTGQDSYSIPTDMFRLQKMTVLDFTGNEVELSPITFDEFKAMTLNATDTTGTPQFYCIKGDEIFLAPTPVTGQVTMVNGLNLYISREGSVFISTDTTKEAGIPEPFCSVLALGPSGDYWLKSDAPKAREFYAQISETKAELMDFNENRVEDIHPRLNVGKGRTTRQYT